MRDFLGQLLTVGSPVVGVFGVGPRRGVVVGLDPTGPIWIRAFLPTWNGFKPWTLLIRSPKWVVVHPRAVSAAERRLLLAHRFKADRRARRASGLSPAGSPTAAAAPAGSIGLSAPGPETTRPRHTAEPDTDG